MVGSSRARRASKADPKVLYWRSVCQDCGFVSGFAEITWDDGTKLMFSGAGCKTRRDLKAVKKTCANEGDGSMTELAWFVAFIAVFVGIGIVNKWLAFLTARRMVERLNKRLIEEERLRSERLREMEMWTTTGDPAPSIEEYDPPHEDAL